MQRESLSLETRIAQLKAAISQNCPSSDNLRFQARLLQAEDRQRDLALQTDSARSRAFPRSTHPSTTMPPKQPDLVKAEDALRTSLLKEFQALKESATAENTDADAWNVISHTTPEELTSTVLGHLDRYESITQDYAVFTQEVAEGKRSRREARSSASELRDQMQTITELLSNLNDNLGGVAPVLAETCADVLSEMRPSRKWPRPPGSTSHSRSARKRTPETSCLRPSPHFPQAPQPLPALRQLAASSVKALPRETPACPSLAHSQRL